MRARLLYGCVPLTTYKLSPRRTTSGEEEGKARSDHGSPAAWAAVYALCSIAPALSWLRCATRASRNWREPACFFRWILGFLAWFRRVLDAVFLYGCYDSDSFYPCTLYIHWCNAGKKGGGKRGARGCVCYQIICRGERNILDRVQDDIIYIRQAWIDMTND